MYTISRKQIVIGQTELNHTDFIIVGIIEFLLIKENNYLDPMNLIFIVIRKRYYKDIFYVNARNVIFIMNINNKISFSLRDNLIIMKLIAITHNIINKPFK